MSSESESPEERENLQIEIRRRRFIRELVGIFLGASAAMMAGGLLEGIRTRYSLGILLLWGGAAGGLLASYERFERAGAALTRGENKFVNYLVGFGLPVGLLLLIYLISK